LLELIDVVHLVASTLEVNVLSSHTRLLKELDILNLFGADQDRLLQVEMNNNDNFFRSTRLEETVLDVREADINLLALASDIP
jgi:hypothetical protein